MSRKSVLTSMRTLYLCELCGAEITQDVVRVDESRVYHLACFRRHLPKVEIGMYECPKCRTLGRFWDSSRKSWRACSLCGGGGYLAAPSEACGN
jgi:ribosomal protein L37AE/L43A